MNTTTYPAYYIDSLMDRYLAILGPKKAISVCLFTIGYSVSVDQSIYAANTKNMEPITSEQFNEAFNKAMSWIGRQVEVDQTSLVD